MSTQLYYRVCATIFFIIAVLHLARIAYGWVAVIGGFVIPLWFSWVAAAIAAYLAYRGFSVSGRTSRKAKK